MNNNIEDKIILLKREFEIIKEKGWIKSSSNGRGNIGMTFERELGLTPNQFEIPDFDGIEIKTKQDETTPFLTLFSATFDGTYLFEMRRVAEMYGEYDRSFKNKKILYCSVNSLNFTRLTSGVKMRINVCFEEKKVYLLIYDNFGNLIDRQSYWSFELLKGKLERKLSYLALVSAKRSVAVEREFFYYYDIKFMRLKSFSEFLRLLDLGKISIYFKYGVYRSGTKVGKSCDHGTSFDIRRDDLKRLFDYIY